MANSIAINIIGIEIFSFMIPVNVLKNPAPFPTKSEIGALPLPLSNPGGVEGFGLEGFGFELGFETDGPDIFLEGEAVLLGFSSFFTSSAGVVAVPQSAVQVVVDSLVLQTVSPHTLSRLISNVPVVTLLLQVELSARVIFTV